MNDECDEKFARIVSTLHSLEKAYVSLRRQGLDTASIERTIRKLLSAMDDNQRQAYVLYQRDRGDKHRKRAAVYKEVLEALDAIIERRQGR
jgi:hypothetical protein